MTHHHTQLQPGETPLVEEVVRSIQRHEGGITQQFWGKQGRGIEEKIFHHTDLLQGFQCLRNHALTVLQFAHSHQLDSPQWMETRIIQSVEEKGGKCVTVSSHLHSHCFCRELLGWDCKVIVNVNKVLREN